VCDTLLWLGFAYWCLYSGCSDLVSIKKHPAGLNLQGVIRFKIVGTVAKRE